MTKLRNLFSLLLWVVFLAAAPASDTPYIDVSRVEITALLSAPPAPGSPESVAEIDAMIAMQKAATPEDLARSKKDERRDPSAFSSVIGGWFTEQNLPETYRVLNKAEKESQSISEKVKRVWKRPRPPVQDSRIQPTINLPSTASYPSGHALQGMEWALLLAGFAPDLKDQIMLRGQEFGQSRVLGGVHFPSDIAAGQRLGEELYKILMASPAFQADFALAKKEFDEVRARNGAGH